YTPRHRQSSLSLHDALPICGQIECAHIQGTALDGRALGALKHVAGEGADDRHGTGATACYRNGVNVLLGPTAQVRLGETADLAAVADQCGTVRTNPVDRHRTTNGCRATALDRAGQRGDGQAVAATDVQPQCLVRTGGHQPAVVDQHLIFTVDH